MFSYHQADLSHVQSLPNWQALQNKAQKHLKKLLKFLMRAPRDLSVPCYKISFLIKSEKVIYIINKSIIISFVVSHVAYSEK